MRFLRSFKTVDVKKSTVKGAEHVESGAVLIDENVPLVATATQQRVTRSRKQIQKLCASATSIIQRNNRSNVLPYSSTFAETTESLAVEVIVIDDDDDLEPLLQKEVATLKGNTKSRKTQNVTPSTSSITEGSSSANTFSTGESGLRRSTRQRNANTGPTYLSNRASLIQQAEMLMTKRKSKQKSSLAKRKTASIGTISKKDSPKPATARKKSTKEVVVQTDPKVEQVSLNGRSFLANRFALLEQMAHMIKGAKTKHQNKTKSKGLSPTATLAKATYSKEKLSKSSTATSSTTDSPGIVTKRKAKLTMEAVQLFEQMSGRPPVKKYRKDENANTTMSKDADFITKWIADLGSIWSHSARPIKI